MFPGSSIVYSLLSKFHLILIHLLSDGCYRYKTSDTTDETYKIPDYTDYTDKISDVTDKITDTKDYVRLNVNVLSCLVC